MDKSQESALASPPSIRAAILSLVDSARGWLALLACAVVALVESNILGWAGSLLIVVLLNFASAGGLVFLAIRRSKDLQFCATRRQLGLKITPAPSHD